MSRLWLSWLVCCAACQPVVNVGTDTDDTLEDGCGLFPATVSCPAEPWGAPRVFAQEDDLRRQLVGRWAFCGGERKYTGRGPLGRLPGGVGIEFWEDQAQLRFAWLHRESRARRTEVPWEGTVRLELDGPRARVWLVAADAQEVLWETQLFEAQPVLRNSAFDVWDFVRL